MLFWFMLVVLVQSLCAVELSIYKSFTEIRQTSVGIGEYRYSFTETDIGNLIDGSIGWEGTPLARMEIYKAGESLKDVKVIVRRSSICSCETIEAEIVDPSSMLLKNLNTDTYFYADKESIEYTSVQPSQGETILSLQFQTELTQHIGTLSYLMKGITWKPSYDLVLSGNNDFQLYAYATIRNDQEREYTIEMTRLLGGDVQLASGYFDSNRETAAFTKPINIKPILLESEQKGLYSYTLKDKYTLRPSSSIRLPFIDISALYQFYYKALVGIGAGMTRGVFDRNYDITPDHFMPAGVITVRDNHILVGQAVLPDVPQNYTQTFTVGQDNDIRYLIQGNMTSKTDDKAPVLLETFELDVQVMNFKNKNIRMQLILQSGLQLTVVDTTCMSVNVQGNQIYIPFKLEQNERRQCKLHVTVRLS